MEAEKSSRAYQIGVSTREAILVQALESVHYIMILRPGHFRNDDL